MNVIYNVMQAIYIHYKHYKKEIRIWDMIKEDRIL